MYKDGTRKKHITKKVHGFLSRMSSRVGQRVIKTRRAKGRYKLTV